MTNLNDSEVVEILEDLRRKAEHRFREAVNDRSVADVERRQRTRHIEREIAALDRALDAVLTRGRYHK